MPTQLHINQTQPINKLVNIPKSVFLRVHTRKQIISTYLYMIMAQLGLKILFLAGFFLSVSTLSLKKKMTDGHHFLMEKI